MTARRPGALIALLLACALAGCGAAAGASQSGGTQGLKTVGVQAGGHQRSYLLYVPPGDSRAHPLPLVLVYHGAEDTAAHTANEVDLLSIARHRHNMILVFPQGYQNTWNEGAGHTPAERAGINDVAFTALILHRVESHYAVDPQRVVATGISNGALLTEDLGCTLSNALTLIVPVEGQLPASVSSACHPSAPISVYEIHGTADHAIPYSGGSFHGIGGGTSVLSAPGSVARWAGLDHCSPQPGSRASGRFSLTQYGGCQDGVTVTLATLRGGQHAWPPSFGQTLVAAMSSLPKGRRASS